MQIVIDIPEEIIADAKTSPNFFPTYHFGILWGAVKNGTPLPKGHGRLIDADALANEIPIDVCDGFEVADIIDATPTIIEADKE